MNNIPFVIFQNLRRNGFRQIITLKQTYIQVGRMLTLKHICKFVSDIGQIHPFGEGNTRTTAVFTMKYLHTFGFTFDDSVFQEHSKTIPKLLKLRLQHISANLSEPLSECPLFDRTWLAGTGKREKKRKMDRQEVIPNTETQVP